MPSTTRCSRTPRVGIHGQSMPSAGPALCHGRAASISTVHSSTTALVTIPVMAAICSPSVAGREAAGPARPATAGRPRAAAGRSSQPHPHHDRHQGAADQPGQVAGGRRRSACAATRSRPTGSCVADPRTYASTTSRSPAVTSRASARTGRTTSRLCAASAPKPAVSTRSTHPGSTAAGSPIRAARARVAEHPGDRDQRTEHRHADSEVHRCPGSPARAAAGRRPRSGRRAPAAPPSSPAAPA